MILMKYHTLFFSKIEKDDKNLPSVAVVIGALRVNSLNNGKYFITAQGNQWLSGRVLDSRPKGRGFQPHCVVVLGRDTLILA